MPDWATLARFSVLGENSRMPAVPPREDDTAIDAKGAENASQRLV